MLFWHHTSHFSADQSLLVLYSVVSVLSLVKVRHRNLVPLLPLLQSPRNLFQKIPSFFTFLLLHQTGWFSVQYTGSLSWQGTKSIRAVAQALMVSLSVQLEQSDTELLKAGKVIIYGTSKWYSSIWERFMVSLWTVLLFCVF